MSISHDSSRSQSAWRLPLGGCDCYLAALESYMRGSGQGRHLAVSVLEVESAIDTERLRKALKAFGEAYPVLFSEIRRGGVLAVPEWRSVEGGEIECVEHPSGASMNEVALRRLSGDCRGHLCFDVLQRTGGGDHPDDLESPPLGRTRG